jgi:hypothetical protein
VVCAGVVSVLLWCAAPDQMARSGEARLALQPRGATTAGQGVSNLCAADWGAHRELVDEHHGRLQLVPLYLQHHVQQLAPAASQRRLQWPSALLLGRSGLGRRTVQHDRLHAAVLLLLLQLLLLLLALGLAAAAFLVPRCCCRCRCGLLCCC